MSNLIPEKRMNKNGVMVTKHVKADAGTASSATSFPPPAAAPEKAESIVMPGAKVTPMTKEDFGVIGDVLDLCGSHGGDDLYYVTEFIRDGDMDALRICKKYVPELGGFSTICDVLGATRPLFGDEKPANYGEKMDAHMKVALTGNFEYADIDGNPDYEEFVGIIHENTDQVDSIIKFLEQRGVDPDGLKSYLAHEVTPMREGTL